MAIIDKYYRSRTRLVMPDTRIPCVLWHPASRLVIAAVNEHIPTDLIDLDVIGYGGSDHLARDRQGLFDYR